MHIQEDRDHSFIIPILVALIVGASIVGASAMAQTVTEGSGSMLGRVTGVLAVSDGDSH